MITKRKAEKCVVHHFGCACRERQFKSMAQALRIIQSWGAFDQEGKWPSDPALKPAHVMELCKRALEGIYFNV